MTKPDLSPFRFDCWPRHVPRGALAETFVDGRRHGWTIAWYDSGRKACEGGFVDGKEDGWWVFWEEDGSTALAVEFERGVPHRPLVSSFAARKAA